MNKYSLHAFCLERIIAGVFGFNATCDWKAANEGNSVSSANKGNNANKGNSADGGNSANNGNSAYVQQC